ncbi:unnamed protein product [Moneuplotes crassus]|uniref:Uncharacterized protein n=1 Tax=Euplotes crassus TaxID=5936 RepID=A0AAD1XSI3_EUPCR|nr:unnamed protein product [Moneuplotes crassus]
MLKQAFNNRRRRIRDSAKKSENSFCFNLNTYKNILKKLPARKSIRVRRIITPKYSPKQYERKKKPCNTVRNLGRSVTRPNLVSFKDPSFLDIIKKKANKIQGLSNKFQQRIMVRNSLKPQDQKLQESKRGFLSKSLNVSRSDLKIKQLHIEKKIVKKPALKNTFVKVGTGEISQLIFNNSDHDRTCETGGYEVDNKGIFILKNLKYVKKSKIRLSRRISREKETTYRTITINNVRYNQ